MKKKYRRPIACNTFNISMHLERSKFKLIILNSCIKYNAYTAIKF